MECAEWLEQILAQGVEVIVPEIADYEVRRELLRAHRTRGLRRLDQAKRALTYLPLTTAVMMQAAEFWALARNQGRPTADNQALDADMILSAQFAAVRSGDEEKVIATTNVGHLSLFASARLWRDIRIAN
jgi:predicted nucleic acid-binding protein